MQGPYCKFSVRELRHEILSIPVLGFQTASVHNVFHKLFRGRSKRKRCDKILPKHKRSETVIREKWNYWSTTQDEIRSERLEKG